MIERKFLWWERWSGSETRFGETLGPNNIITRWSRGRKRGEGKTTHKSNVVGLSTKFIFDISDEKTNPSPKETVIFNFKVWTRLNVCEVLDQGWWDRTVVSRSRCVFLWRKTKNLCGRYTAQGVLKRVRRGRLGETGLYTYVLRRWITSINES